MNTTKEELWEQLDEIIKLYPECFESISDYGRMLIFNLFWKEIEQREAEIKDLKSDKQELIKDFTSMTSGATAFKFWQEQRTKIQSLEQLLKAAEEVINCGQSPRMTDGYASGKYWDAKKLYTQLKSKTTLKQQMK